MYWLNFLLWKHGIDHWCFTCDPDEFFVFPNIEQENMQSLTNYLENKGKNAFLNRIENVDFKKYYLENPFKESGDALYYWSPIADELKTLDRKIVLNSISLKWGLMKDEFKKLTRDLNFN